MSDEHPVKEWREKQNPPVSQADLAARMLVKSSTVWRWENRKRIPQPFDLLRLSSITGVAIDELIVACAPPGAAAAIQAEARPC